MTSMMKLGVLTAAQIAAHLTTLTGYRATILPDVEKSAHPEKRG